MKRTEGQDYIYVKYCFLLVLIGVIKCVDYV